jgi:hypothetical protein
MPEEPENGEEPRDPGKLELIAHKSFASGPELVYVIDFLNKSLKSKKVMFGLSKDKNNPNNMVIKIYEF